MCSGFSNTKTKNKTVKYMIFPWIFFWSLFFCGGVNLPSRAVLICYWNAAAFTSRSQCWRMLQALGRRIRPCRSLESFIPTAERRPFKSSSDKVTNSNAMKFKFCDCKTKCWSDECVCSWDCCLMVSLPSWITSSHKQECALESWTRTGSDVLSLQLIWD